uniref:LIM zinc-binding domain-containing protein n=1 Tax=Anopheles dirus TaxID=7168 RepID=A0A182N149_9DIPT
MNNERRLLAQRPLPQPQDDPSEHDAVNNRFIEKKVPDVAHCLACRSQFSESLPGDVIQHYMSRRHEPCCRCLYCDGPMYRYRDGKGSVRFYHDCHRSKRMLDSA